MTDRTDEYKRITALFQAGRFEEGMLALEAAKGSLPRTEFLECSGNHYFYKREFQTASDLYEEAMMSDAALGAGLVADFDDRRRDVTVEESRKLDAS